MHILTYRGLGVIAGEDYEKIVHARHIHKASEPCVRQRSTPVMARQGRGAQDTDELLWQVMVEPLLVLARGAGGQFGHSMFLHPRHRLQTPSVIITCLKFCPLL
jgi:hypothetical protein